MERDQVEEIRGKVDIVDIIGERVTLKKAGRHFKGLCPFHSEKSPSFIVSNERQSFKCFGCSEGGDVFTFLQKYEGMSFLEALETLANRAGVVLTTYRPTSQDALRKRLLEIMNATGAYYHFLLTKHESGREALDYLKKRGITNEAIEQFNLGYTPNQWRSVSDYLIKKKGYTETELDMAGLIIRNEKSSGFYDRFRGRVIFPLRDHKGAVVGFSGRTLLKDEHEAKYINSPETILYSKGKMLYGLYENREYVRKENRIILVEGELDMIPSWQAGVKAVAAIKGSAFTENQARLIARYTKNVGMALDADTAGQEAIKRAVVVAESLDLSIRVVQIVGGKDPGDIASESGANWREMVKSSVLYYDFLLDSVAGKNGEKASEETREISQTMVPVLSDIADVVVRARYVRKTAERLGIPEQAIYEEIERTVKKRKLKILGETVKQIETGTLSRRERVEELVLSITLQFADKLKDKIQTLKVEWFTTLAIGKIISKLTKQKEILTISKFAETIPEELRPTLDKCYLMDLAYLGENEKYLKEWENNVAELEELWLREEMKKLTPIIAVAEKAGDKARLAELQAQFVGYSRSLSDHE